jgi:hypothetical protein
MNPPDRAHLALVLPTAAWLVLGCTACAPTGETDSIRIEQIVELGDLSGDGALASRPLVSAQFPSGHYFVTVPWGYSPELVRVFDSLGRYARSIGRFGEGPNEFRRPKFAYRVGDSAYIFDLGLGRLTVMAEGDSTGRSVPWTRSPYTFLALDDGTFVLSTGSWVSGRVLEHVSREGERLRVFGDSVAPEAVQHKIGLLEDAIGPGFWSARYTGSLELQHWNAAGEPGRSVQLKRDWFPEHQPLRNPTPSSPPTPTLVGFWPDSAGALWLVATVADPDWAEGLDVARRGEGGIEYYPVLDRRQVFDTVVERIDAQTGEMLLHRRFDEPFYQVPEPWVLASASESEDGWYQMTLWRVHAPLSARAAPRDGER